MKRFRFPLRPVVVLRAHRELRAREAFGLATREVAAAEAELAKAQTRVAAFGATLAAGRQVAFSASAEANSLAGYRRECAVATKAERGVATANGLLQQRRAEYFEAHRQLDIVERLEVKARAAHQIEMNRHEQAELDDLAGRQASRRAKFCL
jgi:flagellar FliJ protein